MNAHRSVSAEPVPFRFNVEQFELLNRAGAFRDHAKTELLDGTIYAVNAQYRAHARFKGNLFRVLGDALAASPHALEVLSEVSVAVSSERMPEPDLVITSEPDGDGPVPLASVALFIEVSDTTLDRDLGAKSVIYAAGGVPEYWVFDIEARTVHQMWGAATGGYVERRTAAIGGRMAAATLPWLAIDTANV